MPKGTISQYDEESGHGLIEQEDGSEVRFDRSAFLTRSSEPGMGDHVTYTIARDEKGPVATDVTITASYKALGKPTGSLPRIPGSPNRGPASANVRIH